MSVALRPHFSTRRTSEAVFLVSFAFVGLAILLSLAGHAHRSHFLRRSPVVISARYLFFVSVVPLNMALTFVRSVHA